MTASEHRSDSLGASLRSDPASFLYFLAKTKPNEDVLLSQVLGGLWVVQNPKTARWILANRDKAFDKYFGFHKSALGRSRLTADGEDWRHLRDISQENIVAPKRPEIARTAQIEFGLVADEMLKAASQSKSIQIDELIDVASMRVLCALIFQIDPDQVSPTIVKSLRSVFKLTSLANWAPVEVIQKDAPEIVEAANAGFTHIQEEFAGLTAQQKNLGDGNLIAKINASDHGSLDAISEFSTVLVAGYETTSTAISWILYSLARARKLQDQLRYEVCSNPYPRLATEGPREMDLLRRVVLEALRLFPPVPALGRIANRDVALGEVSLNRGQRVVISIIGVNLGPKEQLDRFAFDPDRLLAIEGDRSPTTVGMPFGHGQRICPGSQFAVTEIEAAISTLLQRIVVFPDNSSVGKLEWGVSMRRANGNFLRIEST
ncbi:MAG: cytochrome P450 [Rhizobiaceae bacterium]|nr:cytochrome P450 [Rhizobiaceae bacterium]